MTIDELPEEDKIYVLKMSGREDFPINGLEKEAILKSKNSMIVLRSGDIVNKAFIICIFIDKEATKDRYRRLLDMGLIRLEEKGGSNPLLTAKAERANNTALTD